MDAFDFRRPCSGNAALQKKSPNLEGTSIFVTNFELIKTTLCDSEKFTVLP